MAKRRLSDRLQAEWHSGATIGRAAIVAFIKALENDLDIVIRERDEAREQAANHLARIDSSVNAVEFKVRDLIAERDTLRHACEALRQERDTLASQIEQVRGALKGRVIELDLVGKYYKFIKAGNGGVVIYTRACTEDPWVPFSHVSKFTIIGGAKQVLECHLEFFAV